MQPKSQSSFQSVQSHHSDDTSLQQMEAGPNQMVSFHCIYRKNKSDEANLLNCSRDDHVQNNIKKLKFLQQYRK